MSRFDWPYLIDPPFLCASFHSRNSVSDFTGASGPSVASQALKSRFIPYLSTLEQFWSLPFPSPDPEQVFHNTKLLAGSLSTTLGISAGSTITAPCLRRTAIASTIAAVCSAFNPPLGGSPAVS